MCLCVGVVVGRGSFGCLNVGLGLGGGYLHV